MVDLSIAEGRSEIDLIQLVSKPIRPAVFVGLVPLPTLFGSVAALISLAEIAKNLV